MTPLTPAHAATSYKPVQCCGALQHCGNGDQATATMPCWGEVSQDGVDDEDGNRVPLHSCKGHSGIAEGDAYTLEPLPRPMIHDKGI